MNLKNISRKECLGLTRGVKGDILLMESQQEDKQDPLRFRFIYNKKWKFPKIFIHELEEQIWERLQQVPAETTWQDSVTYFQPSTVSGTFTTGGNQEPISIDTTNNVTAVIPNTGASWTSTNITTPAGTTTYGTAYGNSWINGSTLGLNEMSTLSGRCFVQHRSRCYFLFRDDKRHLFAIPTFCWGMLKQIISDTKEDILALEISRYYPAWKTSEDDYEKGYTISLDKQEPTIYEIMKAQTQKGFI